MTSSSRPRVPLLVQIAGVMAMAITLGVVLSLRHGLAIWGRLLCLGWLPLLVALLAGLGMGLLSRRWIGRPPLGGLKRFGRTLVFLGTAFLTGRALMDRLQVADVWFIILVLGIELGVARVAGQLSP